MSRSMQHSRNRKTRKEEYGWSEQPIGGDLGKSSHRRLLVNIRGREVLVVYFTWYILLCFSPSLTLSLTLSPARTKPTPLKPTSSTFEASG